MHPKYPTYGVVSRSVIPTQPQPLLSPPPPEPKKVKLSRLSTGEQIEAMKEEIRMKIQFVRDQLDAKECELLAEVDRLGDLQNKKRDGFKQELKESKEGIIAMEKTGSKLNLVKSSMELAIADLRNKIIEISQKLEQYEEIKVSWSTEECGLSIDSLCSLSNATNVESIYQSKSTPNWRVGIGEGPSQLSSPTSLAIQHKTDNVFVSDRKGHRVQVYSSSGEHIRFIDKFNGPFNLFYVDDTYLLGISSNVIELNLKTLDVRVISPSRCPLMFLPFRKNITSCLISNNFIFYYASDYCVTTINQFTDIKSQTNALVQNKTQPYSSQYSYPSITGRPVEITTDGTSIYLLFSDSTNLIYLFDRITFEYVRCFLPSSLLSAPKSVCVDGRGNLLVAGGKGDSTRIICLSPDGDLIHELLLPYRNCVSVAVNSKFDISVLCDGDTHGLISL